MNHELSDKQFIEIRQLGRKTSLQLLGDIVNIVGDDMSNVISASITCLSQITASIIHSTLRQSDISENEKLELKNNLLTAFRDTTDAYILEQWHRVK